MMTHAARALGVLACVVLVVGCKDLKPVKGESKVAMSSSSGASGPKVKLEFYVMSKCPFGSQVEQAIKPVLDEIGGRVDFQLNFIAQKSGDAFSSMHGEDEVKGDLVQVCAMKHYPDVSKYMAFISCQNKNQRSIPNGWESCATKAGLDVAKLKTCYEGDEGKKLLAESVARTNKRGARGSPTIYLADESYSGGRGKNDFMRAICQKMEGEKPGPCADIPEPVEVKAIVLTDKRCKKCAHEGLASNLRGRFFPKLTVRAIDYNSDEGRKLYKELKLKMLPVWLFEKGVEKAEKWSNISRWMAAAGKYQKLRVPATFDPTAEICDNKKDDTGNGKVDCDDSTCKNTLECRDEKKNHVEVFVMSQCPFGVRAVDAMKEVLPNFKDKVHFDVHYIASADASKESGFSSLHGPAEVRENLRQLCAKKYYARNNKYLDYIWCRNKNIHSEDWKECATGGISAAKIEKCSTGAEGKRLLAQDIKIAAALNISGSPTWLANNRFKFSGVAADAIKSNICQHNPKLPNCDKKLTQKANVQGSCN